MCVWIHGAYNQLFILVLHAEHMYTAHHLHVGSGFYTRHKSCVFFFLIRLSILCFMHRVFSRLKTNTRVTFFFFFWPEGGG